MATATVSKKKDRHVEQEEREQDESVQQEQIQEQEKSKEEVKKTSQQERDEFGSKKGSQADMINMALIQSEEPLTVKEVAEKAGLSDNVGRVRSHIRWLEQHQLIKRDGKGFLTTGRTRAPSARGGKKSAPQEERKEHELVSAAG